MNSNPPIPLVEAVERIRWAIENDAEDDPTGQIVRGCHTKDLRLILSALSATPSVTLTEEERELVRKLRYGKGVESWWQLGAEAADLIERLAVERP